jgi:hypothetical protein
MPTSELLPEILGEPEALTGRERKTFADGAIPRGGKRLTLLSSDVIPNRFGHHEAAGTPLAFCFNVKRRS